MLNLTGPTHSFALGYQGSIQRKQLLCCVLTLDRELTTEQTNNYNRAVICNPLNLLEWLTRAWVTQGQLHHRNLHPRMSEDS